MSLNSSIGRQGDQYQLSVEQVQSYKSQGYLVLEHFLTESELQTLDPWFEHFIQGKEPGMRRDYCDMSQPYDTPKEQYRLVNAMLPSVYRTELRHNIYYKIASSVVRQLYTEGQADMDYEQFLAKKPGFDKAKFAMHQDLGYWPKTDKTWTATFSLALSHSTRENGCLQVIPGSNNESTLRQHLPSIAPSAEVAQTMKRDDSHSLELKLQKQDEIAFLPVKRGSVTIHDERIIHGSGGNLSDDWRRTYVMAFRDVDAIAQERAIGFTHSHNDNLDWKDVL